MSVPERSQEHQDPTADLPPDPGALVAIDAAVIGLVSAAICLASQRWLLMTILVPAVLVVRLVLLAALARRFSVNLKAELLFFAICTLLGAFNDWNSVVNHRIYDYTVPHRVAFSTIPIWMLLFWGMILRFIARLARWGSLGPPGTSEDRLGLGRFHLRSAGLRVIAMLGLVLATRQAIYRLYLDPIWSWVPFLVALLIYLACFWPTRHDLKLLGLFMVGGPVIEVLYIQVGGLHRYHLGWIAGVPVWIALWWLVIVLIWKDLAFRLERHLRAWLA